MLELSKAAVEANLGVFIDNLFLLPEVACVKIKGLEICRDDNKNDKIKLAVNKSYHDSYSDIDLCVMVKLSAKGGVASDAYIKHIEHWGFPLETILGVCFVPENHLCRIVRKNGMRYDIKFEFLLQEKILQENLLQENAPAAGVKPMRQQNSNANWPIENIYRFWFVQVQALGKLYRNDFLISSHLANTNINETLVQQMILRDLKYNTNHHRYGYQEELMYLKYTAQCPYQTGNPVFDGIADRIYAAALAYDELAGFFYDNCEPRSKDFFALWESYEGQRAV